MIIPTVTTIAKDALEAVPEEYKQASIAMGATRWQTIYKVILPSAKEGLLVALILGIGRAIGETMAVQLVIGNARQFPNSLTSVTSTLTSRIVTDMGESTGAFRSALFVQGLVLLILAMAIILLIRLVTRKTVKAG
jgi:phosphate transport system permease protein